MTSALSLGIRIVDVSKRLGPNQALDKLSMTFAPGTIHGLIGPEGAGKTTLLRNILGLLKPDQGEIIYEDGNSTVSLASVRDVIAYMPQQQSLYADLSISEHLDFFKTLYQIPKNIYQQKRKDLLHLTRLAPFADRPAGKLSGGMYKKLGLMCALLRSPQAVLLDEPTNGVDPLSRREFWDLLKTLQTQGILVIIATAYMDEAEKCPQVHLIESGRCLAEGSPQAILQQAGVDHFDTYFIRRSREVTA